MRFCKHTFNLYTWKLLKFFRVELLDRGFIGEGKIVIMCQKITVTKSIW